MAEGGCPAVETLRALLTGEVAPPERQPLLDHTAGCPRCRAAMVDLAREATPSQPGRRGDAPTPPDVTSETLTASPHHDSTGFSPPHATPDLGAPVDATSAAGSIRLVDESEYTLGRELARGGMGRIVEGFDRRHQRRVAIKFPDSSASHAVRRFHREARIAARLQHPSIVPVYEAGQTVQGRPCFVMKLVEGRSLEAAIRAAGELDDRLALLPHVIAATEALAYAHDQRIVHRDLKPANLLIGAFGETVVIDWGLAKDLADPVDDSNEPAIATPDPPDGLTVAGAAMGTPAYMAPEQARGEPIDTRVDVYALGALLYHVLAGVPPYRGDPGGVLAGPPRPLESLAPRVPPDLAAVVHKAMARAPGDRYPTAAGMADDLRRFSTGQLVQAHTYPLRSLIGRWIDRHRAAVMTSAVLLAALAATGAVSVVRIVRERDRAEAAQAVASAHRDAAEQLVEFLVVKFRDRVRTADRLDLLVGVGDEVAAYYRRLDQARLPVDPASLSRRAAALETLAAVESNKKNQASARGLYQQAIALRDRAAASRPLTVAELIALGDDWRGIGTLENEQGNLEAALTAYDQALAVADRASRLDPQAVDPALLAAGIAEKKAITLHFRKGDVQAAFDVLAAARDRLTAVLRAHPDDRRVERRLAGVHADLHLKELYLGRLDDAARSIQTSIDLYARATEHAPDDAGLARAYAGVYFGLSGVELARGRLAEARAAMRLHLERYQAIAARDPENLATQRDLGWSHAEDCSQARRALALTEAAAACGRAAQVFRGHVQRDPKSDESRDGLINALVNQARVELAGGRPAAARAPADEAVALARALVASDAEAGRWREDLALSLVELGRSQLGQQRSVDAARTAAEALALFTRLAADSPSDVEAEGALDEARLLAAEVDVAQGQVAPAIGLGRAAVAGLDGIAARSPAIVFFQVRLARALAGLAAALDRTDGGRPEAAALRTRALQILDGLRAAGHLFPEDDALRGSIARAAATVPASAPRPP